MIRDKRLLALTAAVAGCVVFTAIFLLLLEGTIWAINIGLILGAISGAALYWFKDRQERKSIKQTVREKT
jgi:hypothetical protein